jgi:hypothetical protein
LFEALGHYPKFVILNLFQDPFLTINGGLLGKMDPEPSSG